MGRTTRSKTAEPATQVKKARNARWIVGGGSVSGKHVNRDELLKSIRERAATLPDGPI